MLHIYKGSNLIDATTSKPRSCFWAASKNHSFSKRGFLCSKSTATPLWPWLSLSWLRSCTRFPNRTIQVRCWMLRELLAHWPIVHSIANSMNASRKYNWVLPNLLTWRRMSWEPLWWRTQLWPSSMTVHQLHRMNVFRFYEMPHKHSLPHSFSLLLDFREQKRDEESEEVKRNIIR